MLRVEKAGRGLGDRDMISWSCRNGGRDAVTSESPYSGTYSGTLVP